jgi:hypothetical protein
MRYLLHVAASSEHAIVYAELSQIAISSFRSREQVGADVFELGFFTIPHEMTCFVSQSDDAPFKSYSLSPFDPPCFCDEVGLESATVKVVDE